MTARFDLDDFFDRERSDTIRRIERFGYTAQVVGTGQCSVPGCTCGPEPYPWSYSLGFYEHDHPELVAFGLSLNRVNQIMDPIFAAVRDGRPLAAGREHAHDLPSGDRIGLVPVPELWARRDPNRIAAWIDVYRTRFPPMLQVVWSDGDGAMPWDPECEPAVRAAQPILADDPLRYPKPPRTTTRHPRRRR